MNICHNAYDEVLYWCSTYTAGSFLMIVQALLEFRAFDFLETWIFAVYEQPQLYVCITTTIAVTTFENDFHAI